MPNLPADTPMRPLQKGQATRAAILDAALGLASHMGLEGLSIGALAEVTGMSKSGVFAHFGSREELQISVVREYHARFEDEVFHPALAEPRGLPRLRALFERWVKRVSVEIDSGCIYISGAVEFDDRPGPVRDALVDMVQTWQDALERAIRMAVEEGHLRADTVPAQMLFELEPTGLKFNPLVPAQLKIHYDHADGDLNDDGSVDSEDSILETTLAIWRQENPGDPFVRLTSVLSVELDEVEAELTGFSRYALAY